MGQSGLPKPLAIDATHLEHGVSNRDSTDTFTEGTAMLLWQIATVSLIPFHVKSATKCSFHDAISVLHYTANTVYSQ